MSLLIEAQKSMPARRLFLNAFSLKVCIFVSLSSSIFSQEYSYRHYTVKDGLVQNQVICMFQDSQGYLWLGTKGGVSRFDGLKFQNYTVNDGLLSNQVIRVFEDSEGGINFSSHTGISRFHQGKITTVLLSDTIKSKKNNIVLQNFTAMDICFLNSRNLPIYIGPVNSSISRLISGLDSLSVVYFVLEDNYNKLWLRSDDDRLYSVTEDTIICYVENIKANPIMDKAGKMLFYSDHCLYMPDTLVHKLNKVYCFEGEENSTLFDFDPDNRALFQFGQKNIVEFDGQKEKRFIKKFNYINDLLTDQEKNLWIATESGLYKKISNAFENFTTETGANEYVWSIVEDDEKNIWFASYGDGLCKWDGENISRITGYLDSYSSDHSNYFYTGAILASNRNLYFPIKEKGILQYDGKNFSLVQGLPKGSVLDVFEDRINHRLLAASTAGFIILENYTTPVQYEKNFIEVKKFIKTIAQDKYGRYWLGGEYMLNIFYDDKFIELPNEQFDYNHGAISIFKDHLENLWLGTTAGLYFFDYNEFKRISPEILDSQVSSIVEYDSAFLFMGVNKGLAFLDLNDFYKDSKVEINILDESNGFLGFDCIRNGILKDSENNIWVASSDRVVKFYPDRLEKDTMNPVVYIEKITATGSKPEYKSIIDLIPNFDTVLELPYFLRNFKFDFHAVHFRAPEKIKYSYRLLGYDKNWSDLSNERYVSFTNLPPGQYTFEVTSQNIDGLWSKNPASVTFEIVPAFWQTLAFKLFVNFFILILFLATGYFWMQNRRKQHLKKEETERQISELQLKTIRSQMDPHFTFNALNSISSVIYKEDKEKAYRYFTKFSKLVRSSLEDSDRISRSLDEEIEFTKNYLDLEKIRFGDQFEYSFHINNDVNMDTMVPKMIIHNYAENAVKHGLKHKENNRMLNIDISIEDSTLNIVVEDNGVGRQQAGLLNEFSTGKGLRIMNNIYDLYFNLYKVRINQNLEDLVDDEGNGIGTRVALRIPIKN